MTVEIAENRKNYVDKYQNICETMKLLKDSDKSDSLAEGWILLLNSATDACFQKIPVLNVVVDLTTDALTSKAKELCNDEYDCTYPGITSVEDAVGSLANIIGKLAVSHPNYAATFLKNLDSFSTHEPKICLAWLMSFDSNYQDEIDTFKPLEKLNNIGYRANYINCPVNVEVYCNNKLVGEIIDDEPQEIEGGSIITSVEDGGKVVYLPFDADYEIKIIATDDGLLDYSISEYSYYTGFTNRVINYYDLELTDGEAYIAEIPTVDDDETLIPVDVEYTLKTNDEVITPDLDVTGDEVIITDGVTSIGYGAFSHRYSLNQITIPDSVTNIEGRAFFECGWTSIKILNPKCKIYDNVETISDTATIDDTVTIYGYAGSTAQEYAEKYDKKFEELSVISGTCGENVIWHFDEGTEVLTISGTGKMTDFGYSSDAPWYEFKHKIKKVAIENGITSIGDRAFFCCWNLTSIIIPDSITSIGEYAFWSCSDLTSIKILNPQCEIYDSSDTISSQTIYGYKNSTAQEYAEKYDRTFVEIADSEIVLGDVNSDGMIDAVDASMILAFYAYLSTGGTERDMRVWLDM